MTEARAPEALPGAPFDPPSERRVARAVAVTVLALCVVALAGLWWGQLDVVAVASGKVVAAGANKVVQALELTAVKALLVKEGDTVERHQPLIALDASAARSDVRRLETELASLAASSARTDALLARLQAGSVQQGGESAEGGQVRRLPVAERAAFDAEWTRFRAEQRTLAAETTALRSRLASAREHCRQRAAMLVLLDAEAAAIAKGHARGVVPRLQWSQHQRERLGAAEALTAARSEATSAASQLQAVLARGDELRAAQAVRWREVHAELASRRRLLLAEIAKARQRVAQSLLRAPVRGIVHALKVPAAGAVVSPAQPLLEIVPADVPLVIDALLANDDAGRVQPGQEAVIKIDSFNYTRFGTLRGRVVRVSADAVGGAGEPLRFVAQVELLPGSDGESVGPGPLRPGMSGQVEFQLGRRRAMDYVLGPLRRVVDESAREP